MQRIVVGIDGSQGSVMALRWAVAEAALRSSQVEAIHAFHVPVDGSLGVSPVLFDVEVFRQGAVELLAKAVSEVDAGDVPVVQLAVEGGAATVLVEAGRGSSLLVVGARGHGGLIGMLLGSVSRQVSEHADVPVVVVPATGGAS